MTKMLVLYYSSYGHIETMARALADGASEAGAAVDVKRVPETVPPTVAAKSMFRVAEDHPEADPAELSAYDAIVVGTPTNYGNMSAQVSTFWARTTGLWKKGALIGKVGSAFSSTSSQHGGNEASLLSMHRTFLHHGMIVVGLPYSYQGQLDSETVAGGSPYGATTIAGSDMTRRPIPTELNGARFQGKHVAEIAARQFD